MSSPTVHRAHPPAGYGLPLDSAQLTWAEVDERLRDGRHDWIGTIGDDGLPIVRPIDAMSEPAARWRRNLTINPTDIHVPV